jgi:hypothetical protein
MKLKSYRNSKCAQNLWVQMFSRYYASHIVHKLALCTLGTNHVIRIHTCNSVLSVEHTHTLFWIDLDLGSFHLQYLQLFSAENGLHYMLCSDF